MLFFFMAGMIALAGGGYWYWAMHRRRQVAYLLQEDRVLAKKNLAVERRYMGKRSVGQPAWLMVHKLLWPYNGNLVAFITERDAFPMDPFGEVKEPERKQLGDITAIAREHLKNDRAKDNTNQANRLMVYAIGLMIAVVAIIFLITGIILIMNKVDMGAFFGRMFGGF